MHFAGNFHPETVPALCIPVCITFPSQMGTHRKTGRRLAVYNRGRTWPLVGVLFPALRTRVRPRRSSGVIGLIVVFAFVCALEAFLRSSGAIEAAVRAANEHSVADVYEAIPILSLRGMGHRDGHTFARVRLFDRREKGFPSTIYVDVMRVSDAFWVPEDHPLFISQHY